eukprot:6212146-Pleurochrysis_carterae.AAC.3
MRSRSDQAELRTASALQANSHSGRRSEGHNRWLGARAVSYDRCHCGCMRQRIFDHRLWAVRKVGSSRRSTHARRAGRRRSRGAGALRECR